MTDNEDKKLEVFFLPGCFDTFDGSQEELDELISEIQRLVETGEIFEKGEPVDFDDIPEGMSEAIDKYLAGEEVERKLN